MVDDRSSDDTASLLATVIDGSSYPIALGQGSDLLGLSDDWWLGAPPGWSRDANGYLHTPDGFGKSVLGNVMERILKVPMTARNWNTVLALRDIAGKS